MKRILSGITPSGSELHIGNYFGMVKPALVLQANPEYSTYYFIADLHALTTIQERSVLERNIREVVLDYLALGLDPAQSVFFRQSDVSAHAELSVVLSNYIGLGQMQRMHAFKDKLQKGEDVGSINMGLFNYPVLMAADILLYKPFGVPVGEDQRQHVELTRDIADNFNRAHGRDEDSGESQPILPLPEALISKETGRIVGTDGQRKMSKSLGNIISIFAKEEEIRTQIMSCYTDPSRARATDPGQVEGNPVFIYHDLINDDQDEVADLKRRYREGRVGDVEVKEKLLAAHARFFGLARERRAELAADPDQVKSIMDQGAEQASQLANQTLAEVYQAIGLT